MGEVAAWGKAVKARYAPACAALRLIIAKAVTDFLGGYAWRREKARRPQRIPRYAGLPGPVAASLPLGARRGLERGLFDSIYLETGPANRSQISGTRK